MDTSNKPDPQMPASPSAANGTPTDERPAGGETLARAAQGAHRAVDATVAKVAPIVDGVHDKVESVKGAVSTADEWIVAAREAIKANPFAAIAGAALIGAAYMSLKRR